MSFSAPPLQLVDGQQLASAFRFTVSGSDNSAADRRAVMAIGEASTWTNLDRPELDRLGEVRLRDATVPGFARADRIDGVGVLMMSDTETSRLVDGIERLRKVPFDQWSQRERHEFVATNMTVLHELGHLNRKGNPVEWNLEEALLELRSRATVRDWMHYEYEVRLTPADLVMPSDLDAYAGYAERAGAILLSAGERDAVAGAQRIVRDSVDDGYEAITAGMKRHADYPKIEAELKATYEKSTDYWSEELLHSEIVEQYLATGTAPRSATLEGVWRLHESEAAALLQ